MAAADFNRRRVSHRPCRGADGAGKHAFAHTGLVAEGFRGFAGVVNEGRFAVDAHVGGNGFGTAEVGKEREGNGRHGRGSGRRRPAEIGQYENHTERAVFTGDFVDGHDGVLCGVRLICSVRTVGTHATD